MFHVGYKRNQIARPIAKEMMIMMMTIIIPTTVSRPTNATDTTPAFQNWTTIRSAQQTWLCIRNHGCGGGEIRGGNLTGGKKAIAIPTTIYRPDDDDYVQGGPSRFQNNWDNLMADGNNQS